MKICPKCGNQEFYVPVLVRRIWTVDSDGDYIDSKTENDEPLNGPAEGDEWSCTTCGYHAVGYTFEMEDDGV